MLKSTAYYETRIALGWSSVLPALIMPIYALVGVLSWLPRNDFPLMSEILQVIVLVLPLAAGLGASHLMTIEREEQVDSLRRSYPEPTWRLPFIRYAGALLVNVAGCLVALLIFHLAGIRYPIHDMVLPAAPAALFMLSFSLLIGNVSGVMAFAVAAVGGYWMLEYQSGGSVTGVMYLFASVRPPEGVDPAHNAALLCLGAAVLFAVNILWYGWRRRVGG